MATPGSSEVFLGCSEWDNSNCEGTDVCPPRCPRYIDSAGKAVIIRPLELGDRRPLQRMYDSFSGGHQTKGLPPATVEERAEWLDRLIEIGWNLVAVIDNDIIGHVAVSPVSADEPEFIIFVHPDFQDRGIGSEMIRQVIAHAASRSHEALSLFVSVDNDRAIQVYENIGFKIVQQGLGLKMNLSLDTPIAKEVQLPPADRP